MARKKRTQSLTSPNAEYFSNLTYEQKLTLSARLSNRANERIRALEKENLLSSPLANAKDWLLGKDRKNFYRGKKFKDEAALDAQLAMVDTFLTAKASSLRVARQYSEKIIEGFEKQGVVVSDPKTFYNFLSSKQFEALKKYADSDQIVNEFIEAMDEGIPLSTMLKAYDDFLAGDIPYYDEIITTARSRNLLH